jgi:hypothetical protein
MHTNTGRQTRQKLREPLQRAQRLYFFYFLVQAFKNGLVQAFKKKPSVTKCDCKPAHKKQLLPNMVWFITLLLRALLLDEL